MRREGLRGMLTDVTDGECVDEASQPHYPARRDRLDELRRGPVGKSIEREQLFRGEMEQVRGLGHVPEVEQLIDHGGPEPLDVHGPSSREVDDHLAPLRRTERVQAAPDHLPRLADQQRLARRAPLGHLPGLGAAGTLLQDDPDDLGDDVAGLVEHDGVADAYVLARYLVLVVEGATANRRPRNFLW